MSMEIRTAKGIRELLAQARGSGRNVYLTQDDEVKRIVDARQRKHSTQVRTIQGKWLALGPDSEVRVYAQ